MKTIFKRGLIGLIILAIMLCPIIIMNNKSNTTENTLESIDEVPLQPAVENKDELKENIQKEIKSEIDEENKMIKQYNAKKKSANKVTVKKVAAKKVTTKKTVTKKVTSQKVSSKSYQEYAHNLVINTYGWTEYDFECLVKLWNKESRWSATAHNDSSGAHGIPQAKPGNKMRSEGKDWRTNGYTQIRWGLKYIKGRYGSPTKAWNHSQRKGWY